MAVSFFTGKNDTNLNYDAMIDSGDLYAAKYEYISVSKATLSLSVPTSATLTINDSSASFTADEFNSTAHRNLLIIDNNGVVASAKVKDTTLVSTTRTIVFDSTDCLLESDGATAATLTTALTYSIAVLTGDNTNLWGKFWGYVNGNSLEVGDEFAEYYYGIPQQLKYKDLIKRSFALSGGSLMCANEDVVKAILNGTSYGLQTGQFSVAVGFNPDAPAYYRMALVSSDKNNRAVTWLFRKGQFELAGNVDFYSTEHKIIPYKFTMFSDGFYPANADAFLIKRAD